MDFKAIYAVVDDDFEAVNQFISHHLDSNVPLIREVGDYICLLYTSPSPRD